MKRLASLLLFGLTLICFDSDKMCINPEYVVTVYKSKIYDDNNNIIASTIVKMKDGTGYPVSESVKEVVKRLSNSQ